MSKAVLVSIKPEWCELIAFGKKTIEIRKTCPKLDVPFKAYIYCSKGFKPNTAYSFRTWCGYGKVIGEFTCDRIIPINVFPNGSIQDYMFNNLSASCVSYGAIANYIGNGCSGTGWHISDLVIYDKPKDVSDFHRPCTMGCLGFCGDRCTAVLTRPPQSWCYVEELSGGGSDG